MILSNWVKNKKTEHSPVFSPNLTMNLTYLCYGSSKVMLCMKKVKGICSTSCKNGWKDK